MSNLLAVLSHNAHSFRAWLLRSERTKTKDTSLSQIQHKEQPAQTVDKDKQPLVEMIKVMNSSKDLVGYSGIFRVKEKTTLKDIISNVLLLEKGDEVILNIYDTGILPTAYNEWKTTPADEFPLVGYMDDYLIHISGDKFRACFEYDEEETKKWEKFGQDIFDAFNLDSYTAHEVFEKIDRERAAAGLYLENDDLSQQEKKYIMRGYKGFEADMTCRDFQYEVGKTYEIDGEIKPCERGFHFCRNAADVLNYYGGEGCRYAEVEAFGEVINGEDKSVTSRIRMVRELTRTEILEIMYAQEELDFEDAPFPADEIIRAREDGTLGEMLPSGTQFPVTFANGEKNILVVCRDRDHTYLVTKYIMAEPFVMNSIWTNKGGWPACRMREHVRGIYDMLPEDIKKSVIPLHIRQQSVVSLYIRQLAQGTNVKCDDMAFLLSATNVFGTNIWVPKADCDDRQIDIFQKPVNRIKRRPGASSASWWWLRSASFNDYFASVYSDGSSNHSSANAEGGVVVGFCIESRG